MMEAFVLWVVDPIHIAIIAWVCGMGTGYIAGRSMKTRPLEIERDKAKNDLQCVLHTFELKKSPPPGAGEHDAIHEVQRRALIKCEEIEAATIERCAQVAYNILVVLNKKFAEEVSAAIRALKDEGLPTAEDVRGILKEKP